MTREEIEQKIDDWPGSMSKLTTEIIKELYQLALQLEKVTKP